MIQINADSELSVADQLENAIREGQISPGERFPSERSLAESLNISRHQARQTIGELEARGLLGGRPQGRRIRRVQIPEIAARRDPLLRKTVAVLSNNAPEFEKMSRELVSGMHYSAQLAALGALQSRGLYVLMIAEAGLGKDAFRTLGELKLRGVLAFTAGSRFQNGDFASRLAEESVPLVVFEDQADVPGARSVRTGHAEGARLLVEHLTGLGCRRLLHLLDGKRLSGKPLPWLARRLEGFRSGCATAGVTHDVQGIPEIEPLMHLPDIESFESRVRLLTGYLVDVMLGDDPVDAILCPSDAWLPVVNAALRKLRLTPGKDVQVTGYDNFWKTIPERRFEDTPPAATIERHTEQAGRMMVELLLDEDPGKSGGPVNRIRPELITKLM